jgi:hypothetical protein
MQVGRNFRRPREPGAFPVDRSAQDPSRPTQRKNVIRLFAPDSVALRPAGRNRPAETVRRVCSRRQGRRGAPALSAGKFRVVRGDAKPAQVITQPIPTVSLRDQLGVDGIGYSWPSIDNRLSRKRDRTNRCLIQTSAALGAGFLRWSLQPHHPSPLGAASGGLAGKDFTIVNARHNRAVFWL